MNRNTESHFAELPNVDIERSIFDRSFSHKTSFNCGDLIPFYLDEVLPGDTFNVTTSCVVRLQTLLTPIFDNVYLDTYFFFVPSRIVWNHWKEFMGENTDSAWIPQTEYSVPQISFPTGGFDIGTIADYFGVPTGVQPDVDITVSALPFRAYAMIADQWFRDQNVMDPLNIPTGDANVTGVNTGNYITDTAKGGKPFKVAKYHDYFTSVLPSPQKAQDVYASLIQVNELFPVYTGDNHDLPMDVQSLRFAKLDLTPAGALNYTNASPFTLQLSNQSATAITPFNLYADVSFMQDVSVNQLRLSFQLQKYYEKLARAGSRYREVLREHFGVTSPDARMMIPEYLGGHRFPLAIHQVTNTSQGESDFLGDLGAMSNTADVHDDFVKSFTEHGYIIGVCCVRYDHSYPQGLNRLWSRKEKLDYYWPVFANIGEQPVSLKEIYLPDVSETIDEPVLADPDRVFGYQEAWADYRFMPSRISGELRPTASNSLASWHLSDDYASAPSYSADWIVEDKSNLDRVLAVTSAVSNQVFADFFVKNTVTRAMPMYSIPGLIDHH